MLRVLSLATILLAVMTGSVAAEQRCGWIVNPTPGNWWLIDRQGQWIIAAQAGVQATGMDNIPDLTEKEWVETNGSYGHGCGCLVGKTNKKTKLVTLISKFKQLPLAKCQGDKRLAAP